MSPTRAGIATAVIVLCAVAAPRPSLALDLESALLKVTAANPTLAAGVARAEAAKRRVGPAGAWESPTLELGVVNVPTSGGLDSDPMTMEMLRLSQRVPAFGANRLAREAARAEASGEAAAAEVSLLEIWGMTWETYGDAYVAGELARLAEAHDAEMAHMILAARARYESGNGRLEDILRAQAEQANTLSDAASFRAEEAQGHARLDALRGIEPGPVTEWLAPPPAVVIPATPDAWLAALGPAHPRLRAQRAQVDRYRLEARAARRAIWPDLELSGTYGRREPLLGRFSQPDMFSASVAWTLPIFAISRQRAEAAGLDAMARASDAERTAAELDLRARVLAAHAAAVAAQRAVALLADTVVTTQRRASDASWISYRAGTTDLWRVFESTHALYADEIALLRARQNLSRAEAQLLSLTGRGDLLGISLAPPAERSGR